MSSIALQLQFFINDFIKNGSKEGYKPKFNKNSKDTGNLFAAYVIRHIKTGRIYPDNGVIPVRNYRHLNYLKEDKHYVKALQDAYNDDPRIEWMTVITESSEEAENIVKWIIDQYKDTGLLFNNLNDPRLFNNVPDSLLPVIDGVMAGDGHISPSQYGNNGSCSLILGLGLKQIPHAEEFADRLSEFGFVGKAKVYEHQVRVIWNAEMFKEQRKRWYPDGKKRLPENLSNHPEMWRWLYAGDGSIYQCSTYGAKISFHTQSFTLEENQQLIAMLHLHGIDAWPTKDIYSNFLNKQLYRLDISTSSTEKFLQMTSLPVAGLEYKWTIPNREERMCGHCDAVFVPKRTDQMFCSKRCAIRANHPAYSKDPLILKEHYRKRKEYEEKKRLQTKV